MEPKKVRIYDMANHGRLIKEYPSINAAAKNLGCDHKTIMNYNASQKRMYGHLKVKVVK